MRISVFGSGYVGLVTASCFAQLGNNVCCVDIDPRKVEKMIYNSRYWFPFTVCLPFKILYREIMYNCPKIAPKCLQPIAIGITETHCLQPLSLHTSPRILDKKNGCHRCARRLLRKQQRYCPCCPWWDNGVCETHDWETFYMKLKKRCYLYYCTCPIKWTL